MLLAPSPDGLHCAAGRFHIDPTNPVARAVITHAHSDHARPGCQHYFCSPECLPLLRLRLGTETRITPLPYAEPRSFNGVTVSLHPSGHILGAAQVRVEYQGEVWVASGDYKLAPDPTCTPFEPVRCDTFITEATFALPIYRWPHPDPILADIHDWWRSNRDRNRTSILFAYSLGKAQRLLAKLDPSIGPILAHDRIRTHLPAYAAAGVHLPEPAPLTTDQIRQTKGAALLLAPPAAAAALRIPGDSATAFASGWMLLRGTRRRQNADRGFPLSDHADWPGLLEAIRLSEARRILVTHGNAAPLVRFLQENGLDAAPLDPAHP